MGGHEEIGGHIIANIGGMTLHLDTIIYTWIVIGLILLLSLMLRSRIKTIPGGLQIVMEFVLGYIGGIVEESMGEKGKRYMPLIISLFLFIFISNQLGLLPTESLIKSPTSDLNTTIGLALMVFVLVQLVAIKHKGLGGYLKHFMQPYAIFLPINLIEELAKPITLSFRLFGNILAGEIVLMVLGMLAPYVVPAAWILFSIFVGTIQAFIFTMLTMSYLSNALSDSH